MKIVHFLSKDKIVAALFPAKISCTVVSEGSCKKTNVLFAKFVFLTHRNLTFVFNPVVRNSHSCRARGVVVGKMPFSYRYCTYLQTKKEKLYSCIHAKSVMSSKPAVRVYFNTLQLLSASDFSAHCLRALTTQTTDQCTVNTTTPLSSCFTILTDSWSSAEAAHTELSASFRWKWQQHHWSASLMEASVYYANDCERACI